MMQRELCLATIDINPHVVANLFENVSHSQWHKVNDAWGSLNVNNCFILVQGKFH